MEILDKYEVHLHAAGRTQLHGRGQPARRRHPNLKAFVNNVKPTAAGKARLAVRHTAQAPAVNVWGGSSKLVSGTSFT